MDQDKKFGFFIIGLGLVLMIVIIYFIFFHKFGDQGAPNQPDNQKLPSGDKKTEQPVAPTPPKLNLTPEQLNQEDAKREASQFAERFGSFSNQAGGANLEDLKLFMTSKMITWADNFVKEQNAKGGDYTVYTGISTRAIVAEVKKYEASSAEILVKTQRLKTEAGKTLTAYQDLLVSLVKIKGQWKIDGATWK